MTQSNIDSARQRLPLRQLMTQFGHAPKNDRWKDMGCPFCKADRGAGVFTVSGNQELFKCHHTSCPSGSQAVDEVGYVGLASGLARKEAYRAYLQMAGVWREQDRLPPSVMPGQRARKRTLRDEYLPSEPEPASPGSEDGAAALEAAACPPEGGGDAATGDGSSAADEGGGDGTGDGVADQASGDVGGAAVQQGAAEVSGGGEDAQAQSSASSEPGFAPGATPGDSASEAESEDGKGRVLAAFYGMLTLEMEDLNRLMEARGLSATVIEELGFRSGRKGNEDLLYRLADQFKEAELVESGLWVQSGGEAKPNRQYYGFGLVGKNSDGSVKRDWSWPILIPYWDGNGRLVALRPHKDMVKGSTPHLYVARGRVRPQDGRREWAVITEGEFKAAAIHDGLEGKVAAAAIPGISMSKNWLVEQQIEEWLRWVNPKRVLVVFDNEEKGDPRLPGFKPERRRRWDSEIWARYLVKRLGLAGFVAKLGRLPDEWRDEKGKADWDGALARLRREGKDFKKAFLDVLRSARDLQQDGQEELFASADEQVIRSGVSRLFYTPKLPVGGDKEFGIAQKLARMSREAGLDPADKFFAMVLSKGYRDVTGRYFNLKPLRDPVMAKWRKVAQAARKAGDTKVQWVAETVMKGIPSAVSDFSMEPLFVLMRLDEKRDRVVKLRNVHGEESEMENWDAKAMSRPTEYREWLANRGNYKWGGNERDLQALHEDVNTQVAFRNVQQVAAFGHDERSGLWFFRDAALSGEGGHAPGFKADECGVVWHEGTGYLLGKRGKDNQTFRQGMPSMRPDAKLMDAKLDWARFRHAAPLFTACPETEEDWTRLFFREVTERFRAAVGGYEAYACLGVILGYAAAPELFTKHGAYPGLWLHGQTSSGKTTLGSWLMEFWGFRNRESGLGLKSNMTMVGLQIALEQYSNIPVWADEYVGDADIPEGLKGIIHASYNREIPSKWAMDGNMRTIRTNLLVTGETTPGRSATRSRFVLVQCSAAQRMGTPEEQQETYQWIQDHRGWFFVFAREALRRRKEFVAALNLHLKEWREAEDVKNVEERTKFVHGVAYAAMKALVGMFESHVSKELQDYRKCLVQQCVHAVKSVEVGVNVNQFWTDLVAAYKAGVFGHGKSELSGYFKVTKTNVEHPPRAPNQGYWKSYRLYFNFNAVIPRMREFLRRQGREMPLDRNDLRDQMSKQEYWVSSKDSDGHKQRFGGGASTSRCWGIELDMHELGYRWVDDDEWREAALDGTGVMSSLETAGDPRKGELFEIVEVLQKET